MQTTYHHKINNIECRHSQTKLANDNRKAMDYNDEAEAVLHRVMTGEDVLVSKSPKVRMSDVIKYIYNNDIPPQTYEVSNDN